MSSANVSRKTRSSGRKRLTSTCDGEDIGGIANAKSPNLKQGAGVNCMSMNRNIISCSTRRVTNVRRNMKGRVPHLPQEIIFNILLWLPAEIIYDVMRYVCRQWYNIIHDHDFISAHLALSSTGLLIKNFFPEGHQPLHFAQMREGVIKITEVWFKFPLNVWSSCNGLVLMGGKRRSDLVRMGGKRCSYLVPKGRKRGYCVYHVVNPVTMQLWTLPPLHNPWPNFSVSGISYAASTGKYKVVQFCNDGNNKFYCAILTLGVDKAWRQISTKHIPDSLLQVLNSPTKCTPGVIYWAHWCNPCIMALDVETEIVHQIPFPEDLEKETGHFAVMGNSLSFITAHNGFSWELRVLREAKTGEWIKLPNIDLECHRHDLECQRHIYERMGYACVFALYPSDWLKNGELLIFRLPKPIETCIIWDIKTGEITSYQLDDYVSNIISLPHVSSLVALNLC